MTYSNPWIYENQPFDIDSEDNPFEGFVYIICNTITDRKYIGKKTFWFRRKDKKTQRRKTRESDWRDYYSSSDDLLADVKAIGEDKFNRFILHLCTTKKQMTFLEQKEQWDNGVLLTDEFYNTNIGGKFFVRERKIYCAEKKIVRFNDKWREEASERLKKRNPAKTPEARAKISAKKRGENHHQYGKPISETHKEKLHAAARAAVISDWNVITPDGENLVVSNMLQFCRDHGLTASAMTAVAQGKRKTHKGYRCTKVA